MVAARLVDLAVGEAGGRLVEQQQLGLADQGPGELDALERAVGQAGGRAVGEVGEVELARAIATASACEPPLLACASPMRSSAAVEAVLLRRAWAPTITFSSTVMPGHSARFWKVRTMPSLAIPCGGSARRSRRRR